MKRSYWFYIMVIVVIVLAMALFGSLKSEAATLETVTEHKVDICHATSSSSNPFTSNNVDGHSILKSSGHNGHGGDIIPAFYYYKGFDGKYHISLTSEWYTSFYAGKNLTTDYNGKSGQWVLDHGCSVPEPPEPVCEDDSANNYGGPLPCTYDPPPVCEDEIANNYGGELPCTYDEPPVVCEDETATNFGEEGECQYPEPTPEPTPEPKCNPEKQLWVWDLLGQDGRWQMLLDRGYDGTYAAPSVAMQCYYFGCDWKVVKVWGHWVTDCEAQFEFWNTLPFGSGGGKCSLP